MKEWANYLHKPPVKLAYPFQNLQYTGLHFSFLGEVIYFTEPTTEFFLSLSQYITFVPKLIFKRKPTAEKLKKPVGLTIIPIFPADTVMSPLSLDIAADKAHTSSTHQQWLQVPEEITGKWAFKKFKTVYSHHKTRRLSVVNRIHFWPKHQERDL